MLSEQIPSPMLTPIPSCSPYKSIPPRKGTRKEQEKTIKDGNVAKSKKKNPANDARVAKLDKSLSSLQLSPTKLTKGRSLTVIPQAPSTVMDLIKQLRDGCFKNIVIMCGAGISTGSGIPDFRSPKTGLYDNLQQFDLKDPCDVFDIDFFLDNPYPFFKLSKDLYPCGKYLPNEAHYFMKILLDKGMLRRVYTQNIDGLERAARIPVNRLVEAHGTFTTATCLRCKKQCAGEEIKPRILQGKVPRCHLTPNCFSVVKPDIVFFGEDLPKDFHRSKRDFKPCDLLIIMGTSLQVTPFSDLADTVPDGTPRLLLNRDKVGPFVDCKRKEDFAITGDITTVSRKLLRYFGWESELDDYLDLQKKRANNASWEPTRCSTSSSSDRLSKASV